MPTITSMGFLLLLSALLLFVLLYADAPSPVCPALLSEEGAAAASAAGQTHVLCDESTTAAGDEAPGSAAACRCAQYVPLCEAGGGGTVATCVLLPWVDRIVASRLPEWLGWPAGRRRRPYDCHATPRAVQAALHGGLVGQDRAIADIHRLVLRWVQGVEGAASDRRPLVLHLAGDNGVGKTRCAELLGLALSRRYRQPDGRGGGGGAAAGDDETQGRRAGLFAYLSSLLSSSHRPASPSTGARQDPAGGAGGGDAMLAIAGASYYSGGGSGGGERRRGDAAGNSEEADWEVGLGMTDEEANATASIVRAVARHAARHPHGLVVFNDFTLLPRRVARAVTATLFARLPSANGAKGKTGEGYQASSKNEANDAATKGPHGTGKMRLAAANGVPPFDPRHLLFVVTTDRGSEGRTLQLSTDGIAALADRELRTFLSHPPPHHPESSPTAAPPDEPHIHTLPFVPLDRRSALRLTAVSLVSALCCGGALAPFIETVTYDEAVLGHLVDAYYGEMVVENGRAVAKATQRLALRLAREAVVRHRRTGGSSRFPGSVADPSAGGDGGGGILLNVWRVVASFSSAASGAAPVHLHFFLDSSAVHGGGRVVSVAVVSAAAADATGPQDSATATPDAAAETDL